MQASNSDTVDDNREECTPYSMGATAVVTVEEVLKSNMIEEESSGKSPLLSSHLRSYRHSGLPRVWPKIQAKPG